MIIEEENDPGLSDDQIGVLWACKINSQREQLDVGTAESSATSERAGHCQFLLQPTLTCTIEGWVSGNQVALHAPEQCLYLYVCVSW